MPPRVEAPARPCRAWAAVLLCGALAACAIPAAGPRPESARPVAAAGPNNARNGLNWVGHYEGVLSCAGCPDIRARLTLEAAGGYELRMQPQDGNGAPELTRGAYTWLPDGGTVELDDAGHRRRFQVLPGRVIALPRDGAPGGPGGGAQRQPGSLPGRAGTGALARVP